MTRQYARGGIVQSPERKAPGRLVEGATVHRWKAALGALAITHPDRLNTYL